ncbi:MAG: MBL fold metallo-hydrolase, partial [Gemmatimonadales bacterium]
GCEPLLRQAILFGSEREKFPVEIFEVAPGTSIKRKGYSIEPFAVDHNDRMAVGYALVEDIRLGRFNPDRARELGIPEGPAWGKLHKGEPATLEDGRVIDPADLVGPSRPGRRIVFTGDTRPAGGTVAAAEGADLLIHESTFSDEEQPRAVETGHSTAREAAGVAAKAGVKQLVLTHLSARYSVNASDLLQQAKEVFGACIIAKDGLEIEVPFAQEDE